MYPYRLSGSCIVVKLYSVEKIKRCCWRTNNDFLLLKLFVVTFQLVDSPGDVGVVLCSPLKVLPSESRILISYKFSVPIKMTVEKFANLLKQLLHIAAFLSFKDSCKLSGRQLFALTSS